MAQTPNASHSDFGGNPIHDPEFQSPDSDPKNFWMKFLKRCALCRALSSSC